MKTIIRLPMLLRITLPALLFFASEASATCQPQPDCEANNTPPTVTLTSPSNGASSSSPGSFTLSANASDDSAVASVEFFSNNVSVGIDSTAPYSMLLGGLATGSYQVKAKATDDSGKTASSTIATVTVSTATNVPPTVSLTSPSNGAVGNAPASFVISATASDSDGTISQVQFKSGSTVISTDPSYPYSFTYSGLAAGTYTFTAVAFDNNNATTASSAVTVTVNGTQNQAPSVSLTAPSNGSSAQAGNAFNLTATASDADGSIASVKFLSNGALLATISSAPFSYTYQVSSAGSYAIQAIATDNLGATATSATSNVTVTAPGDVSETRYYVYDANQRLCKTINPESGATVVDYDGAGNVLWTADGLSLPSTTSCDRTDSTVAAHKTTRTYDAMSRVTNVATPGGTADVATTYEDDGLVKTLTAANPGGFNVVTTYTYNKRRLLTSEAQQNGVPIYPISYGYDPNGHLATIVYPDSEVVDYAPDALGRPTQVVGTSATYASGISYFPNGAMAAFKYGSAAGGGPSHLMEQNTRQLPKRSYDYKLSTTILDDRYLYDANGNVTDITDYAQSGANSQTRGMSYDDLDRLSTAVGPWGNASYAYDALDNLRRADQGTRQFRYTYDADWRLSLIKDPVGNNLYSFTSDTRGNVLTKSGQTFTFDAANRMSSAAVLVGGGAQTFRYDGLGRRVQTTDPGTGTPTSYYVYTQAGQIIYATEARSNRNLSYIYLNGSQIATRAKAFGTGTVTVRYQMTDALGSLVASTNTLGGAASIQRTSYTPWGESSPAVDGTGYTGHVMDAGTGLTYMQQRYYDPSVGRFLSRDPLGSEFNSYDYVSNNPYRFFDPDGRAKANSSSGTGGVGCDQQCQEQKKRAEERRRRHERNDRNAHTDAENSVPLNDPCDNCTRVQDPVTGRPMYVPTAVAGQVVAAAQSPGASISQPGPTNKQKSTALAATALAATGIGLTADIAGATAVAENASDVAIVATAGSVAFDPSRAPSAAVDVLLYSLVKFTPIGILIEVTAVPLKAGHDAAEEADHLSGDSNE